MKAGVNDWVNRTLNLRVFPTREEFIRQGEAAIEYLKDIANKNSGLTLYTKTRGTSESVVTAYSTRLLSKMKDEKFYNDPGALEYRLKEFDNLKDTIDMGGAFKKARLIITDDERGIFNFSLASQQLYRVQEYYSQDLAIDSPGEFSDNIPGIVPPKEVEFTISLDNEKLFWYTSKVAGKKYSLRKQQMGTASILEEDSGATMDERGGVLFAVPSKTIKSKLVFKTRNKKSYVMFERKGGKAKMVEIYIPIHGTVGLGNILPIMLVAKLFSEFGIKTRISAIRMYDETYPSRNFKMWSYPVKDYGDEIDFNAMALNCAFVTDNWWGAVQCVVRAISDSEQIKNNNGNPRIPFVYGAGKDAGGHKDYVECFSRYRNWYMDEIEAGRLEPLQIDKKLMLIGKANYGMKEEVLREFFRILDTVDFQFNKPEDSAKRIYKRMVDDRLTEWFDQNAAGKTADQVQTEMDNLRKGLEGSYKTYTQSILVDTYTYPTGGMYAEKPEDAEKMEDELEEKLMKVNDYLRSIGSNV